jgi:hypothetical protein
MLTTVRLRRVVRNYNRTLNARAEALSAIAACHTHFSTTMPPTAAFAGVDWEAVVLGLLVESEATSDGMKDDEDEDDAEEDEEDEVLDRTAEDVAFDAATPAGGGVAVEGSTSAPTPQGMAAPLLGCTALAGGTLWPVAEAIVKRVVHVISEVAVAVNW